MTAESGQSSFAIRHGLSEGNVRGIIQGTDGAYPLTTEGHARARALASRSAARLAGLARIVSSTAQRARETAEHFAEVLGLPVTCTDLLTEVDPGVLGGLTRVQDMARYPCEHAIWMRRGDLDGIEGAEEGDRLQARVVAFLHRYIEAPRRELIVAHAGLNRCLVNTLNGRPRTTPIDVDHDAIHVLPPLGTHVRVEGQPRARKSTVYKVTTRDKVYTLKHTLGPLGPRDRLQHEILEALRASGRTPRLLTMHELAAGAAGPYTLKVFDYLPGVHHDEPLPQALEWEVIAATYELNDHLRQLGGSYPRETTELPTIGTLLRIGLDGLRDSRARDLGLRLLADAELEAQARREGAVPVNFDLHRSNIVFEGARVSFIDLETFVLAPSVFQLSSLLVSAFLLVDPSWTTVERVIRAWPEAVVLREVMRLMLVRAFVGAAYFEKRVALGAPLPDDERILAGYLRAADVVEAQLRAAPPQGPT